MVTNVRKLGGAGWNLWRIFIGIAYPAAAVFNTVYTLPSRDQLDGNAEGAWFGFRRYDTAVWEVVRSTPGPRHAPHPN